MFRILLTAILLAPFCVVAQNPDYPQDYFRNPLAIPILLAGNFGECRPGHFHSGIDIKTDGRENLPVFAAADGYVSRVKLEPGGYGHGLYITHPNGYTTLYAHLNNFFPALQQYIRKQQYAIESWTLDLNFTPNQFPVKKGQQIAFSGNTGASTAPHLHFEIRDTKTEHPLNPQLFGFNIKDSKAPVLQQLAIYDGNPFSTPLLLPLKKSGTVYRLQQDTLTLQSSLAGLGIISDDFMEGSDNTLTYFTVEWYMDDSLQGRIRLDDIGYGESRYLNAFADYGYKQRNGNWVQRLYRLKGNKLGGVYESLNDEYGRLKLLDENYHKVRIVLKDVYANATELRFTLRGISNPIEPVCDNVYFEAGRMNTVDSDFVKFYLKENALYDDACIAITTVKDSLALSPRISIGSGEIPAHSYFDLSIRPDKVIPFALRSKIALIYNDGKKLNGKAAVPSPQRWYVASVRALGEYFLTADTVAPELKPIGSVQGNLSKAKYISFRANDNYTSVQNFRAELDGKWLLFEQHGDTWTYTFDEHCSKGVHRLIVSLKDENNNETRKEYTFTR